MTTLAKACYNGIKKSDREIFSMQLEQTRAAGAIAIAGALLFILAMLASESAYPNYSWANNYISDLGVGPTATLFNPAAIVFGALVIVAGVLFFLATRHKLLPLLIAVTGVGIIGVGAMPETTGSWHTAFAGIAFSVGALAAIASSRLFKKPANYFFVMLGLISLAGIICLQSGLFFGLGPGGIERVIAYPILLWLLVFGFILAKGEKNV